SAQAREADAEAPGRAWGRCLCLLINRSDSHFPPAKSRQLSIVGCNRAPESFTWFAPGIMTRGLRNSTLAGRKPLIHYAPECCNGLCLLVEEVFKETGLVKRRRI